MSASKAYAFPKGRLTGLVTAEAYLSLTLGIDPETLASVGPKRVIICLESGLHRASRRFCEPRDRRGLPGNLSFVRGTTGEVGICGNMGIGSPVLALLMEDLVALGAREFIAIGTAGLLAGVEQRLDQNRLMVCDAAVSDEGTSHHYIDVGEQAGAAPELTDRLIANLADGNTPVERTTSWSTDAPYRESAEELAFYRANAVKTVDMEASALFAVARRKSVDIALAFAISDAFVGDRWVPYYGSATLKKNLRLLLDGAMSTFGVPAIGNVRSRTRPPETPKQAIEATR